MALHPEGTADFLVFPQGRILWCEIKGPGQKTKKERAEKQSAFAAAMIERGHEYVRAETVAQVMDAIKGAS